MAFAGVHRLLATREHDVGDYRRNLLTSRCTQPAFESAVLSTDMQYTMSLLTSSDMVIIMSHVNTATAATGEFHQFWLESQLLF